MLDRVMEFYTDWIHNSIGKTNELNNLFTRLVIFNAQKFSCYNYSGLFSFIVIPTVTYFLLTCKPYCIFNVLLY